MPTFIDGHRFAAVPSAVRHQLQLEVVRGLVDKHGAHNATLGVTNLSPFAAAGAVLAFGCAAYVGLDLAVPQIPAGMLMVGAFAAAALAVLTAWIREERRTQRRR